MFIEPQVGGSFDRKFQQRISVLLFLGLLTLQLCHWCTELCSAPILQPALRLPFGSFGGAEETRLRSSCAAGLLAALGFGVIPTVGVGLWMATGEVHRASSLSLQQQWHSHRGAGAIVA